jgi:hypothetical protein
MSGAFGLSWPEILNALKYFILPCEVKMDPRRLEQKSFKLSLLKNKKFILD